MSAITPLPLATFPNSLQVPEGHCPGTVPMPPKRWMRARNPLSDYPMVAPNHAAQRGEIAKRLGLGDPPASNDRRRRSDAA